ncbi:OmpH family outer membrane protein [Thermodesulfobacteriota bacterium]
MKKLTSLLILSTLFLLVISFSAQAAEVKIGIIDTQKIMAQSKKTIALRASFFKDIESKRNEYVEKQTAAQELNEELQTKAQEMTIQVRREKAEFLNKTIKELQRMKEDIEFEAKLKDEELSRKFVREIAQIIRDYQKNENYTIIFEKNTTAAFDDAIDITDKIIEIYDSGK